MSVLQDSLAERALSAAIALDHLRLGRPADVSSLHDLANYLRESVPAQASSAAHPGLSLRALLSLYRVLQSVSGGPWSGCEVRHIAAAAGTWAARLEALADGPTYDRDTADFCLALSREASIRG